MLLGDEVVEGICEGGDVTVGPGLVVGTALGNRDAVGTIEDEGVLDGVMESPRVEGVLLELGNKLGGKLMLGREVVVGEIDGISLVLGAGLNDGINEGGAVAVGP